MKHVKRILAFALTFVMAFGFVLNAYAEDAGKITIKNAQVDATYGVYKLFDATVGTDGKIAYSLPEDKSVSNDEFFNTYFVIVNGNVIQKNTFNETVLKSDEFKEWALAFGTQIGEDVKATSSTLEFTNLPYGYYFIKSNVGPTLTIDSTNPNAEVIDKNETVTFDKDIVLSNNNRVKVNEAGLYIPINFDITVNTKNYDGEDKVFKYVVNDTMDPGFSLTSAPVVTVGNRTLTAGTNYTITYTKAGANTTADAADADAFVITIPWTTTGTKEGNHLYDNSDVLHVTYTAILDPAKASSVYVGTTPNVNTAEVNYYMGNDIPDSNQPSGKLGEKKTETYDTGLTITKRDGEGNILTGAQFTLTSTNGTKVVYVTETKYVQDADGTYYMLNDGTYTDEAPNGNATHDALYKSTDVKYKKVTEATVMGQDQTPSTVAAYVDDDGKVTFTGLGVGTYKIEETKVPDGYNKAADIVFEVTFDSVNKTFASDNSLVVLNSTGVFETTVVNNKGTELPSTGGIGTTIFYIVGGVMVAGAVVFLLTKRRMTAE